MPEIIPPILQDLQVELDENAFKIAQLVTTLILTLDCYTGYYAELLREAAPYSSAIPETAERLQSALSAMENLTQSSLSLLRTYQPHSSFLLRILNSDEFRRYCHDEAGKFFL